jgi:hypothetical protein
MPVGSYDVLATWRENKSNASNATYTVNGVATPPSGVNQRIAPGDIANNGTVWAKLGTLVISGGQLTVVLSDQANGNVVADAIRVVAAGPAGPGNMLMLALPPTKGKSSARAPIQSGTAPFNRAAIAAWLLRTAGNPGYAELLIGQLPGDPSTATSAATRVRTNRAYAGLPSEW